MSSAATTQFYGLTQYTVNDKPDFADNNQAFRNVDADLHQVVQDSQGFTSEIADLTERVGNLDTDLTNLSNDLDGEKAKITALQNKELSQDTEISRVERNAQDMITAYNEASATSTHAYAVGDYFIYNNVLYQATATIAVGDTIVPDTNCTTTNVTSELIQLNNDLTTTQELISEQTHSYLVNYARVRKYGQVVDISINGLKDIPGQTSTVIFTLSEAYRPSRPVYMNFVVSSYVYQISVATNGDVTVFCEQVSPVYEAQIACDFTYVI